MSRFIKAEPGTLDLEICISQLGNPYLRTAPNCTFQDNLGNLIKKTTKK